MPSAEFVQGVIDGAYLGLDTVGALFSIITKSPSTVGSLGLNRTYIKDKEDLEAVLRQDLGRKDFGMRLTDVNYDSFAYNATRIATAAILALPGIAFSIPMTAFNMQYNGAINVDEELLPWDGKGIVGKYGKSFHYYDIEKQRILSNNGNIMQINITSDSKIQELFFEGFKGKGERNRALALALKIIGEPESYLIYGLTRKGYDVAIIGAVSDSRFIRPGEMTTDIFYKITNNSDLGHPHIEKVVEAYNLSRQ